MAECSGKNCTLIRKLLDSKALNCQVCKKLLQVPVFLVDGVGNVCEHCTIENEWKQCSHNDIFNVFLDELIIPCANANVGCNEEMSYKNFEEHSKLCEFRPVKCPHQECTWMEMQDHLSDHFLESHKVNVIDSDTFQFKLNNVQDGPKINFTKLLIKRHLKYLLILKQDEANDELLCTLFKFHKDAPSSTEVMFLNSLGKKYSFNIDLNELNLIDQECSVEKIDLRSIKLLLHEDELTMFVDLPPDDTILQYLECPICNEFMGPPIYLCSVGHTICQTCSKRLEKCPSCTAVISKMIRNYHVESKASRIFYPCQYEASGCTAILPGENIMDHKTNCLYHLYRCPLNCDFQYNSKTILNHLSVSHGNISNKFKFEFVHGCYSLSLDKCKSFMYIDGIFFQFTYNCPNQQLYVANIPTTAVTAVNLEFKKLNSNKPIGPLYCKITLRNLTNQASLTQIQHFKDISNNKSKINSSNSTQNRASSSKSQPSNQFSYAYNPNVFNNPPTAALSSKAHPCNNFPLGNYYNNCYYIPVSIGALTDFISGTEAGIFQFTCELLME